METTVPCSQNTALSEQRLRSTERTSRSTEHRLPELLEEGVGVPCLGASRHSVEHNLYSENFISSKLVSGTFLQRLETVNGPLEALLL